MSDQNITEYYQGSEGDAYFRARDQATIRTLGHGMQAEFFRPHLSFGDEVLDFGCGNGSMASILSEDAARVDGIEVNVHPRSIAREMLGLTVYERIDALPSKCRAKTKSLTKMRSSDSLTKRRMLLNWNIQTSFLFSMSAQRKMELVLWFRDSSKAKIFPRPSTGNWTKRRL